MPAFLNYRVVRRIFVCVSCLFGLLLLTELVARLVWARKEPLSFCKVPASAGALELLKFDAAAGWALRPNLKTQGFGTHFSTNERGLRMDGAFVRKPRTRVRIACYGDDVGFGVKGGGSPYPALLEQEIRAVLPGADVDVVNVSTPGYSLLRIEGRLRDTLGWVQPDIVVVQSFVRDVGVEGVRDSLLANAGVWERTLRSWAMSSTLACGLLERLEGARMDDALDGCGLRRVCTEDYMWCAMRMRDFCRANGVELHMVFPLWKAPAAEGATQEEKCLLEIHGRVKDLGSWHGIPMHDALGQHGKEEQMFLPGEPGLLSAAGHEQVARSLRDLLRLRVWNRINELAEAYPTEMKALDY